jgi:DNA-binding CsgD family transcriptional regulator/PAS domain-containing protein
LGDRTVIFLGYVMAREKAVRDLIRLIYECSADAQRWPHFVESFSKALDDAWVVLALRTAGIPDDSVVMLHGIDPAWMERYEQYYVRLDVRSQRARHFWKPGGLLRREQVIGDAELAKTEFYYDYLRPQQRFYSVAGLLAQEGSSISLFDIGHNGVRPVAESELALLRELVPHLQTAARLHHRIAGLEMRLESASAALDRLPRALIVTDSSGRVLHMNRRAETLLKSNSGLSAAPDGLRAGSSQQTARLRELIARTASTIAGNGQHPGGVMQLQRIGCPPLKLQIAPLASSGPARRRATVVIFAGEPERPPQPDPTLLAGLLDLTPAEARLTAAIASGGTIQQFANETGVSLNTTRTLLKRIFSKTGVARQAELVRLALTCTGEG